jgi:hypothetical protein
METTSFLFFPDDGTLSFCLFDIEQQGELAGKAMRTAAQAIG